MIVITVNNIIDGINIKEKNSKKDREDKIKKYYLVSNLK